METSALIPPKLPTFFTMFLVIYLFARFVLFRNWGSDHRPEASSCIISLAHSTPVVFMAIHALIHSQRGTIFASPNTSFENTVLEYSIAYFMVDLIHYLLFFPTEVLFILHHLATLYVFSTCRYVVHHGAYAIIVLLFLVEITSGCQNVWTLASFRKADSASAAELHDFLSPKFYAFYSVIRGILGPLFMFKMGLFYVSGAAGEEVPMWAWGSWMVVIVVAICVSISWVVNLWKDWYTHKLQKKVR